MFFETISVNSTDFSVLVEEEEAARRGMQGVQSQWSLVVSRGRSRSWSRSRSRRSSRNRSDTRSGIRSRPRQGARILFRAISRRLAAQFYA